MPSKLSNLFAPLAMKVAGGIILSLVVALGVVMWRADTISDQREVLRNRLAQSEANHTITLNSLENVQAVLARYIGAGKAARVAQIAAIEAQAEESAALQSKANELRAQAAALKPDDPCDCSTPDFVMEAD